MDPYTDRIGDRIDHPERVPAEQRHLIADDQQRVARILSIPVSGRVLDVGCSDGAITRRIADQWKVQVIGADLGIGGGSGAFVQYISWDVRHPLPQPHGTFDAVFACEVLEHLTDADVALALPNILACLRPGGDLIVTVPNRYPADLYEVGCRSRWAWPDHRSSYDHATLYDLLWRPFKELRWLPLYDGEQAHESIWLIVHAKGKK